MHVLAAPTPTISPIAEEVNLGLHDITFYDPRLFLVLEPKWYFGVKTSFTDNILETLGEIALFQVNKH